MSFRFLVKRVSQLAGVLVLDGVLEDGVVQHGARARLGERDVVVKTVAFVHREQSNPRELTLTIDGHLGDVGGLADAVLVGSE